jgi:hypothetical protein
MTRKGITAATKSATLTSAITTVAIVVSVLILGSFAMLQLEKAKTAGMCSRTASVTRPAIEKSVSLTDTTVNRLHYLATSITTLSVVIITVTDGAMKNVTMRHVVGMASTVNLQQKLTRSFPVAFMLCWQFQRTNSMKKNKKDLLDTYHW